MRRFISNGLIWVGAAAVMAGLWSLSCHAAQRERPDDADSSWICKFDARRCSESRTAIRGI